MGTLKDITGSTFGRLTIVSYHGKTKHRVALWLASCSCGETTIVEGSAVRSGHTLSCGCLKIDTAALRLRKHGNTTWKGKKPKLYSVWCAMRKRCNNPKDQRYPYYGGRGITVCSRWDDYQAFVDDMGEMPFQGASIDRIDNNLGYSPDNCRWATKAEQSNNRRGLVKLTLNGDTHTLREWESKLGIAYTTLRSRVNRGLSDAECLRL